MVGPDGCIVVVEQANNVWSLPKGGIDEGEDAISAAKREIEEESGIPRSKLEYVKKLGRYERYRTGLHEPDDKRELKKIQMFLFKTDFVDLVPLDKDNPSAAWLAPVEAVDRLEHRKDKEFLKACIAKKNILG